MINIMESDVMKSWNSTDKNAVPLVSVCALSFNHSKYNSQSIILEYEKRFPNIIKPILQKENQYSKGNKAILALFMYPKVKGKYVAICECDDYWIDENKLQKQFDFLEANPDYGLCYGSARIFNQSKNKFEEVIGKDYISYENLYVFGNVIPTLTTMYRTDLAKLYAEEIKPNDKNWLMGDFPMWLWFLKNTKAKFFNDVFSVYRVLEESASHSKDETKEKAFRQSGDDIRKYFSDYFNEQPLYETYKNFLEYSLAFNQKNRKNMISYGKKIPKKYLSTERKLKNFLLTFTIIRFLKHI